MKYRYMRDNLDDEYGFLLLQDTILEIAVYIDAICKENGIDYCLMGGSALGAKRHGGFIPWDDDLDLFMTPDNYVKFKETFLKLGDKKKYYLQEWGAVDGMVTISKLRMNGTSYFEDSFKNWNIHQGIYVDIFILHTCPKHIIQKLHQCLWAKYVIMKGLAIRGYNRRGGFLGLALKVMAHLPDKMWVKYGLKQVYKYRNKDTNLFCNFMGKAVFKNAIYPKECFVPTEYITFEKVQLRAPVKLNEFLSNRFGDYMTPPSPDRIKWEQHAEKWDTAQDFRIVDGVHYTENFEDEKKLI
ncbi:MAG: LicD family protein [Oscillospiraceae bacterium]|nr:LicD family protein [Oscillospiraceae bacterium]